MVAAARTPPSSIGQVPPIQDRTHREFLKRLVRAVEKIDTAFNGSEAENAQALASLRTELLGVISEIEDRLDAIEEAGGSPLYTRELEGLLVTIPANEHGISHPAFASVRAPDGTEVSVALQIEEGSAVVVSSLVPLDGHFLFLR